MILSFPIAALPRCAFCASSRQRCFLHHVAQAEAHRLRYLKRDAKKLGYDLVAAKQNA
jgi:hypothetical protein